MNAEQRAHHFSPGSQLGPYKLLRLLGCGAVGEVWLGERASELVPTQLALKLPYHTGAALEDFRREAEVWIRASNHPNILPLFEANVYEGQIVLASEYAPDGSLEAWILRPGDMIPPIDSALHIVRGVLAGLHHLHGRNIVHRDIKPANIMLQGDTPRLTDFGLARTLTLNGTTCQIAGTPAYMAPEAFDGIRSVQADLWSVGVLLYRLLAGRLPFPSDNLATLVRMIRNEQPAPLPQSIPLQIRSIACHALEKTPHRRYASAVAMDEDFQKYVRTPSPRVPDGPSHSADSEQQDVAEAMLTPSTAEALLVVGAGPWIDRVYKIDKERFVIGRDPSCDVQIDNALVARMHAQVVRTSNASAIEDLYSGNGTFVNGHRVQGRVVLHENDRIHVGPVILIYRTSDGKR